ncbi:MAG: maleylpyruvate isomerase N-terminal domain-containing protein [Acidimicrobiales bacterium]
MDPARHLEILRAEGDRIASLPVGALGATVPSLPDWTVERVVRHLVKVHEWVAGALALPEGASMDQIAERPPVPSGEGCLQAYRAAVDELTAAFEADDPERPAVTFAGLGSVGWWLRRQANEVQVHRIDAQDAVQAADGPDPEPLAVDGAADVADEWAGFFLALRYGQRFGALPDDLDGRSVHLHGTDPEPPADGAEWLLSFRDGGVVVERAHAKGDVALRGRAEDLALVLWRRRPLGALDAIGDVALAERLLDVARF